MEIVPGESVQESLLALPETCVHCIGQSIITFSTYWLGSNEAVFILAGSVIAYQLKVKLTN